MNCEAVAQRTGNPCRHRAFIRLPWHIGLDLAYPIPVAHGYAWCCISHYATLCRGSTIRGQNSLEFTASSEQRGFVVQARPVNN